MKTLDFDELVSVYLDQLLSIHWLRPETALWRTFDCLLMKDVNFEGRSVDLGCGDGTLSYIMAGGKIVNLDVYSDVASLDSFNKGADIYDVEVCDKKSLDTDNSALRYRYSFGIDHKAGLISKAQKFAGFYENTRVHDLNKRLPFEDRFFDAAFSNVLYWLADIDAVLKDWNRVLVRSGKLAVFVPNDNFKGKAWFYYSAPHKNERKYYNFFDRGYNALIKHCYSHKVWDEFFARNGFKIIKHKKYLTDPIMEIWNIGTRPISTLLINMAKNLIPENKHAIKQEWVKYFNSFFHPVITSEFSKEPKEGEFAFHFYILEKTA